jgi:hypothetical protein
MDINKVLAILLYQSKKRILKFVIFYGSGLNPIGHVSENPQQNSSTHTSVQFVQNSVK